MSEHFDLDFSNVPAQKIELLESENQLLEISHIFSALLGMMLKQDFETRNPPCISTSRYLSPQIGDRFWEISRNTKLRDYLAPHPTLQNGKGMEKRHSGILFEQFQWFYQV